MTFLRTVPSRVFQERFTSTILCDCNTVLKVDVAVVVVKWSACLPSTPTIRVRIPLKPTVFSVILCLKRTKINKKRPGLAHFFKKTLSNRVDTDDFLSGRDGNRSGDDASSASTLPAGDLGACQMQIFTKESRKAQTRTHVTRFHLNTKTNTT